MYPQRRERSNKKPFYEPVGTSGWSCKICKKTKANPKLCPHRVFRSLSDEVIYSHLAGIEDRDGKATTIGVYPLLKDNSCWFLAVDFDKGEWQRDVTAFLKTCKAKDVPAYLERSRSGNGAHVWIFFSMLIAAVDARKIGTYLITQTMEQCPEIGLDSYDRFTSALLQNTQKGQKQQNVEKAMKQYKEADRKMQMALLLQTGRFLEEAFNAALKSIEMTQEIVS